MTPPVVQVQTVESGIVLLTMQDRVHKNAFSDELILGLQKAFAEAGCDRRHRVLMLSGYDNYFCSGGTREGLLNLHEGRGKFTDAPLYSLALECEIPVVAAMQGHGIGGGLVFGLFADCVVLSRESLYTANFMKYGFTPGMGATYILPQKLGVGLGHEMLLSAGSYRGAELERRGVPFPVVARAEVMGRALNLARELAAKPRAALVTLKRHLTQDMRAPLQQAIAREVAMHEQTFHEPLVRQRITTEFGH